MDHPLTYPYCLDNLLFDFFQKPLDFNHRIHEKEGDSGEDS